jgi:hypothetical protein
VILLTSVFIVACLALFLIVLWVNFGDNLKPFKQAFLRKVTGSQVVTFNGMSINVPDSWFVNEKDKVKLSFVTMPNARLESPGLVTFRREIMSAEQLMADTARKTIGNQKVDFLRVVNTQTGNKRLTGIVFIVFEKECDTCVTKGKNVFRVWTIPEQKVVIRASGLVVAHEHLFDELFKNIIFAERSGGLPRPME